MSLKAKFLLVVFSATLSIYAIVGGWFSSRAQQKQNDPGPQLRIFENVLQHIQNDYVDPPDLAKVRTGALRGLASGLDPYSSYLTAEQVRSYQNRAKDNTVGIDAELSQYASFLYVIAPVKGGAAERAGIRQGDVIEYIDGKATRDISLFDALRYLQGAPDTEVKVRVLRRGSDPLDLTVRRSGAKLPGLTTALEGKVGVIKVNQLQAGASSEVRNRLVEWQKQGTQKIVLDLRGVAGGALDEGIATANLFIKEGVLAQIIGKDGKVMKSFNADPAKAVYAGDVVLLVDYGSSGASEIVAAAFAEHKRGEIVGDKSYGAGVEQNLFTLSGGDGLLLTVARWASPKGKPFWGGDRAKSGVSPTVEVKQPGESSDDALDEDNLQSDSGKPANPTPNAPRPPAEDLQLKKAMELINSSKPAAAQS